MMPSTDAEVLCAGVAGCEPAWVEMLGGLESVAVLVSAFVAFVVLATVKLYAANGFELAEERR